MQSAFFWHSSKLFLLTDWALLIQKNILIILKLKIMGKKFEFEIPGIQKLGKNELRSWNGGELTAKQEIWLERGIAFVLLGVAGVAIYELGRANG
jgi:hypothetical protein